MADQCRICRRPPKAPSEYCTLHTSALENVENAYSSWSKAYDGKLTKKEFLDRIASLPDTGRWAKEVVQHLRTRDVVT